MGMTPHTGCIRNPLPVYAAAAYGIYCKSLITIIYELLVTYCEALSDQLANPNCPQGSSEHQATPLPHLHTIHCLARAR